MNAPHIGLFALAEQRLAWSNRRQALLAQNIANAATPGFVPRDLPDFSRTLTNATVSPVRTQPNHIAGAQSGALLSGQSQLPTARTPDGNAVELDEQLTKVADTETTQALVTAIYRKYLGLFGLALGKTP